MATNIIMHKKEGVSSEIINESFIRLLKKRIIMVGGEHNPVKFYCLAKDGTGLLDLITHIPVDEAKSFGSEDFEVIQLLNEPMLQTGESANFEKNVIWNPRLMPLDLCQTAILGNMPNAGEIRELPHDHGMDIETLTTISDKKLPFIEMPHIWWDSEGIQTEYKGEWYTAFIGKDLIEIQLTLTQEDTTDDKNVWKHIEDKFKGVVLPTKLAQFSPYYLNAQEKNEDLNAQYEEKIRPYYPTEWYPPIHDDEMEAPLFSFDHEWRDVTKQVRLIYLEGEDDIKSDLYARLWFT
mgnify:CR=1 FL=1